MSVASSRAQARVARARLNATIAEAKARVAPAALADDAKDRGARFVRTKPAVSAAVAGTLLLYVLRRPLKWMFSGRRRSARRLPPRPAPAPQPPVPPVPALPTTQQALSAPERTMP